MMPREQMEYLAIDPGRHLGWAVTKRQFGVIDLGETLAERLHRLWRELEEWRPRVVAMEDAAYGAKFQFAVQLSHAEMRGVVRLYCRHQLVRLVLYKPATIKAAFAGSGRADKAMMIRACRMRLGVDVKDDNVADALAILWCVQNGIDPEPGKTAKRKAKAASKRAPKLF